MKTKNITIIKNTCLKCLFRNIANLTKNILQFNYNNKELQNIKINTMKNENQNISKFFATYLKNYAIFNIKNLTFVIVLYNYKLSQLLYNCTALHFFFKLICLRRTHVLKMFWFSNNQKCIACLERVWQQLLSNQATKMDNDLYKVHRA